MVNKEALEGIVLAQIEVIPTMDRASKFVQVYIQDIPYLRIAKEGDYHSDILKRILDESNTEYAEKMINRGRGIVGIPKSEGKEYEAVGMGYLMRVNSELFIGGESADYKIKFNRSHFEKLSIH